MQDDLFLLNRRLNTPFGYGMRILLPDLPIPNLSIRPSFSYIVAPYSLSLSPPCPIICDVRKSDVPGDILLNIYFAHLLFIRMDLSVMTELAPRSLLPTDPVPPASQTKAQCSPLNCRLSVLLWPHLSETGVMPLSSARSPVVLCTVFMTPFPNNHWYLNLPTVILCQETCSLLWGMPSSLYSGPHSRRIIPEYSN